MPVGRYRRRTLLQGGWSSQYYHSHSEALYNHSTEYDLEYIQDIQVSEKPSETL